MRILLSSALLCALLLAAPASAATLTFTLDGVDVAECNDIWHELGRDLWFESPTADDYLGSSDFCIFNLVVDTTAPALLGSRLCVSLYGIAGVETIEVDVDDRSDAGHTRAFVYSTNGTVMVDQAAGSGWSVETLTLSTGGEPVDLVAVSGDEVLVHEIRLLGANVVANVGSSWSAIKALY